MMRHRALLSVLVLSTALSGCSGSSPGRRGTRDMLNVGSGFPATFGGRMAAVLMVEGVSQAVGNSGYINPASASRKNKRTLNQGNGLIHSQNLQAGQFTTGAAGETGIIETLALNPGQMEFVGGKGSYAPRFQGVSNGMMGRATGFSISVPGINEKESQIAYSTDRSLLFVTAPEIKAVWVIPMSDNGSFLGSPRKLDLRGRPSEIITARSEYGELAAVVTTDGISLITADRFNVGTGGAEARIASTLIQFGSERPTAVAFSPTGQYLFVGTQPAKGTASTTSGYVRVCDVGQMRYERRGGLESAGEVNRPLGCFDGDPGIVSGRSSPGRGDPARSGIGAQPTGGLPIKLAVNSELVVALNMVGGPQVLETPDIDDMDPTLVRRVTGSGRMSTANYAGRSFGFSGLGNQPMVDVAIHPLSNNVIYATKNQIATSSTHNATEMGRRLDVIPMDGSEISSLAMDPGSIDDPSTAELMLIGDKTGFVWVAPLDGENFITPSMTDRIMTKGGVIDVAIGSKTNFKQPVLPAPGTGAPAE